jgi:hypothetical protein
VFLFLLKGCAKLGKKAQSTKGKRLKRGERVTEKAKTEAISKNKNGDGYAHRHNTIM